MKVRLRRVILNPLAFMSIMEQNTAWRVTNGIPAKSEIRGFTLDAQTQNMIVFVEHDSFDEVDVANEVAPLLTLEIRKVQ